MLAVVLVGLAGCDDEPLTSRDGPEQPPPPVAGIQAYLQVDNDQARPGDRVTVYVVVQFGTETEAKLGSYTGRLTFDPEMLTFDESVEINDGLRVINPNNAESGEIRFAGATARGFADLTIYRGVFEVRDADYMQGLTLSMEELSAAESLANLQPQLQVAPRVFLRRSGS
jgi:hypothetical protein